MESVTTHPTAPVQPATKCPPWCATAHVEADDRFHYSKFDWIGDVGVDVEISQDDTPHVGLSLGCDPRLLDLADVDDLIKALTEKRAVLAELSGRAR